MNLTANPKLGSIEQAIWSASSCLLKAPDVALEQAAEILRSAPTSIPAILFTVRAHRAGGQLGRARALAIALLSREPHSGLALRELGLITLAMGDLDGARQFLERAVEANYNDAGAWSTLAEILRLTGDLSGAEAAIRTALAVAVHDSECLAPAAALAQGRLPEAEQMLRLRLHDFPSDVAAIRMMAELATRLGRLADAEKLLRRALEIAPFFDAARELLARNLQRVHRPVDALDEVNILITGDPANPSLQMLKASLLVKTGDQDAASAIYKHALSEHPKNAKGWMSYGHVLKTLGRQSEGVSAYRRAIDEQPTLGEAWWSLANLKTVRFSTGDMHAMVVALEQCSNDEDRLHLHFALGKASEDERDFGAAFEHWSHGNALRRASLDFQSSEVSENCRQTKAFFNAAMCSRGIDHSAPDPIFVIGMPRSGSTLVEQILASHSQIEGTMELPDMMEIAGRLETQARQSKQSFSDMIATLTDIDLAALGEEYLARTRVHRKTGRPYFIDKMPNNWAHVGLIKMILPNAHVIDTRRHPVGCCLSMWKQHFARGQGFSYEMKDLARYYRDYVDLMNHFEKVAPGFIHRIYYEQMVADHESEIRRLLDYLGLAYETSCLDFWQNDRAVRTASSEQVRQPIFTDAVDHWRNFEPWLGPLITELGPVIEEYPAWQAD